MEEPSANIPKPKRKYTLRNITWAERVANCRKGAVARRMNGGTAPNPLKHGVRHVVRVDDETRDSIQTYADMMNLSFGEVVKIAMENLKEMLEK